MNASTKSKPPAYFKGYDAMAENINGMGWAASRDKFNADYPPGQKMTGTPDALAFADGEWQCLCDRAPK